MTMFGLFKPENEPVDPDLPEHLRAVDLADWLAFIARLDIPSERKTVAIMAASWGSYDGADVRPALQTIADMSKRHETNTRRHINALIELGMLYVKQAGGGRGRPTEYRLTVPADITTLPLWLDPDMRRVPAGEWFLPAKTPVPAPGNEDSSNTDSQAPTLPISAETPAARKGVSDPASDETPASVLPIRADSPAPALGNRPVDNSPEAEKGSDSALKPQRYGDPFAETPAPALPDLLQADLSTDQTPGLPQVTASLGWRDRAAPPAALAELVGPPTAEPWISPGTPAASAPPAAAAPSGRRTYAEPDPPAAEPSESPRVVSGGATLTPTPAIAAIFALLDAQPGGGEWYFAGAARELRRDGIPNPTRLELAVRAAAILRRSHPETETRSA